MNPVHNCDLLKQWIADPRSPVKLDQESGGVILLVNDRTRVTMSYCPFCGEKFGGSGDAIPRQVHACNHLQELSLEETSSVTWRRREREYFLLGRDSLKIRLFYCLRCGSKLQLGKNENYFHVESKTEVAQLARQFREITTIDRALEKFGPPDVRRGPFVDDTYPKGERTRIGYKTILFYNRLASTVTAVVIEGLDGLVDVKFYPKEKTR